MQSINEYCETLVNAKRYEIMTEGKTAEQKNLNSILNSVMKSFKAYCKENMLKYKYKEIEPYRFIGGRTKEIKIHIDAKQYGVVGKYDDRAAINADSQARVHEDFGNDTLNAIKDRIEKDNPATKKSEGISVASIKYDKKLDNIIITLK